jgi:hypothetical protein
VTYTAGTFPITPRAPRNPLASGAAVRIWRVPLACSTLLTYLEASSDRDKDVRDQRMKDCKRCPVVMPLRDLNNSKRKRARAHTHTHTHTHNTTHTHTHTHTHNTHTHTQSQSQMQPQSYTYTHTHTCTRELNQNNKQTNDMDALRTLAEG